jgi:hypothetical protein
MSNGKQTKEYDWREDFLAWEKHVPATGEETPVLWNRMATMLKIPAKKKKNYFAWAAVVLLFISGLAFLLNNPFLTGQAFTSTFKNHPRLTYNQFREKSAIPGTAITKKPAVKKTLPETIISIPKKNLPGKYSFESPVVNVQKEITDTPQIAITIPAVQPKKLRVVHMNEWFSPPPPVYASSKEEEVPYYKPSLWPGKNRTLLPPSSNN